MPSWLVHSSPHARIIIAHASSMAIIDSRCMPMGRIIMRIMAIDMSAVVAHMLAHRPMSSPVEESAHIVHACSQAMQASMHACIFSMSIVSITGDDMELIMSVIIIRRFSPSSTSAASSESFSGSPETCTLRNITPAIGRGREHPVVNRLCA